MKFVKWALIAGYIYFILTKTVLFRTPHAEPIFRPLFWELQNGYWSDILLNILLFIPLGLLIGGWKGLIFGLVLSCGIELAQFLIRLGFCELDDVLNNMIGSAFGVGLNEVIRKHINNWINKVR